MKNKENDNKEQEISEMQFEIFSLKTNVLAFASRSKAKAKPQRRTPASSSTRTLSIGDRRLLVSRLPSVKTIEYSFSSWSSTSRRWWSDWVLEGKGVSSERSCAISTLVWWKVEEYNGKRRRKEDIFQYCIDPSGQEIIYLRAFQGHSRRKLIDPSLQDNVLITNDFFEYIYHIGCAVNLHSIVNTGLIPRVQNLSKRQTIFFTSVDPMNKEQKDPDVINLDAPRLAWCKQKVWKNYQNTVYWFWHQTCSKERIKVLSNRTQSSFTTRTQLIVSRRQSWFTQIKQARGRLVIGLIYADQTNTERLVIGQPIRSSSTFNIDFRISGLSNSVVK